MKSLKSVKPVKPVVVNLAAQALSSGAFAHKVVADKKKAWKAGKVKHKGLWQ